MSRYLKLYTLVFAIGFGVLLVRTAIEYSSNTILPLGNQRIDTAISSSGSKKDDFTQQKSSKLSPDYIEKIIEKTRSKIRSELSQYNFSHSNAHKLEDLLMESEGRPIQTLVLSSWRSGSTFFGELLASIPGTYYHYEPLLKYGIVQIRAPPLSTQAVSDIKDLFKCKYDNLEEYFEFGKTDLIQFRQNKRLWEHCEHNKDLCFDADFTSRFCKLFPFQTMKLCRLRLRFVQEILDDKDLNVKVVLLVRDPRGVFNSRRHRYFCQVGLDCWQPELLCADMIRDYIAASQLIPLYPDRIKVLRFEDLALQPNTTAHQILNFLRLSPTSSIEEFLKSHTNDEVVGFDSTYRVSRKIPFKWRYLMNFKDINEIQMVCKEAMRLWGYKAAHNATHMASEHFNPIASYRITPETNY